MQWLLDGVANGWRLGAPFGHDSERWQRATSTDPNVKSSWDENCHVTPLLGGREAMDEIRNAFEAVIAEANAGASCHVYIAGWRLNPNRDMSINDQSAAPLTDRDKDTTAWGLIRRMILARVKVRILLWLPPTDFFTPDVFEAHVSAHFYLARLVKAADDEVRSNYTLAGDDWGVVFLDTRLAAQADPMYASHHQKFIVVRGGATHVAFCGGVDLAYTRRDSPSFQGDWQSGTTIPSAEVGIAAGVSSQLGWEMSVPKPVRPIELVAGVDLPVDHPVGTATRLTLFGHRQIWHDQHLKLEGPVVATLEHVFKERWSEPGARFIVAGQGDQTVEVDTVISSSPNAIEETSYLRTHTVGRFSAPYFIDHGVKPSDVVSVIAGGQPVHSKNYSVDDTGLSFVRDKDNALSIEPPFREPSSGQRVVIQYRKQRAKPLPEPIPVGPSTATPSAKVQVWQTIPLRGRARGAWRNGDWAKSGAVDVDASGFGTLTDASLAAVPTAPYRLGEFSAMAGISYACQQAREFIWVFDQYFWSVPYARLIARRLRFEPALHVVIVLPPWSDMGSKWLQDSQHLLRWTALSALGEPDIADRVAVYVPWYDALGQSIGVYCHAKTQLFDDELLVCGSCNLNERSFSVDTELVCAIESREVVRAHYQRLWAHFVSTTQPLPTTFGAGWGQALFQGISSALASPGVHHLHDDHGHRQMFGVLPNGLVRTAPDPSSFNINQRAELALGTGICEPVGLPQGLYSGTNLADIVDALELPASSDRESGFDA